MLPRSVCYSCKSPNDLFCKKNQDKTQLPQSALIKTSAYGITLIFKTIDEKKTWAPLESPGSDVPRKSIGKKGSWLGRRAGVKIELVSQPFISYRFRYQVLCTSFECQMKCISNLEFAPSVTVYRITVQIMIQLQLFISWKGKQEQEKTDEEYLVNLLFYSTLE